MIIISLEYYVKFISNHKTQWNDCSTFQPIKKSTDRLIHIIYIFIKVTEPSRKITNKQAYS